MPLRKVLQIACIRLRQRFLANVRFIAVGCRTGNWFGPAARITLVKPRLRHGLRTRAYLHGDGGLVAHEPLMHDAVVDTYAICHRAHMNALIGGHAKVSITAMRHSGNNTVRA